MKKCTFLSLIFLSFVSSTAQERRIQIGDPGSRLRKNPNRDKGKNQDVNININFNRNKPRKPRKNKKSKPRGGQGKDGPGTDKPRDGGWYKPDKPRGGWGKDDLSYLVSRIRSYPGIDKIDAPKGYVMIQVVDTEMRFIFDLHNVQPCRSCGIFIHEGTSCETDDEVLGTYYDAPEDPWNIGTASYEVFSNFGNSTVGQFRINNGYNATENEGHVVVVYGGIGGTGSMIGCGVLRAKGKGKKSYDSSKSESDEDNPVGDEILAIVKPRPIVHGFFVSDPIEHEFDVLLSPKMKNNSELDSSESNNSDEDFPNVPESGGYVLLPPKGNNSSESDSSESNNSDEDLPNVPESGG